MMVSWTLALRVQTSDLTDRYSVIFVVTPECTISRRDSESPLDLRPSPRQSVKRSPPVVVISRERYVVTILVVHIYSFVGFLQLNEGWSRKLDIYAVVKSLVWNATQEWTEDMWGRWAYIVCFNSGSIFWGYASADTMHLQHLMLVDYTEAKKTPTQFWDAIDKALAERRAAYPDLPPDDRKMMISL